MFTAECLAGGESLHSRIRNSPAARKEMSYYVIAVAGIRLVDTTFQSQVVKAAQPQIVSPSVNSFATGICTINACVVRATSRAVCSHISALLLSRTRPSFLLLATPVTALSHYDACSGRLSLPVSVYSLGVTFIATSSFA